MSNKIEIIYKKYNNIIILISLFLIFFTCSFDIFLNVKLLGFNIRFAQLAILFFNLYLLFYIYLNKKIIILPSQISLWIWTLLIFVYSINSFLLLRGLMFSFWLFSFFFFVYLMTLIGYFSSDEIIDKILTFFYYSFVFVTLWGLFQFFVVLFRILPQAPLQTQTWFSKLNLPRINGFTYEPSYYVTHLVPLLVFMFFYSLNQENFIKKILYLILTFLSLLSSILSTSRIGWWTIALSLPILIFYILLTRFPPKKFKFIYIILILITIISIILFLILPVFNPLRLLLYNKLILTSLNDSSYVIRKSEALNILPLFFIQPICGYNLSGVGIAPLFYEGKLPDLSNFVSSMYAVNNTFYEVLIASGLIGFVFFVSFLLNITGYCYYLYKKVDSQKDKDIIFSLIFALLIQLFMLIYNQNILRIYVWVNVGMIYLIQAYYSRKVNILK